MPTQSRIVLFQLKTVGVITPIFLRVIHVMAFCAAQFDNAANTFFLCHECCSLRYDVFQRQPLLFQIGHQTNFIYGTHCPNRHFNAHMSIQFRHKNPLGLDIRQEATLGLLLRKGDIVAGQWTFASEFTFASHNYSSISKNLPVLFRSSTFGLSKKFALRKH